jgi:hypothetical protein
MNFDAATTRSGGEVCSRENLDRLTRYNRFSSGPRSACSRPTISRLPISSARALVEIRLGCPR